MSFIEPLMPFSNLTQPNPLHYYQDNANNPICLFSLKHNKQVKVNHSLHLTSFQEKMLQIFNNCGLPICLSGISHPIALYKEMADHDRRREAIKKMKVQENLQGFEMGNGDVTNGNGTAVIHDFSLPCTAKAA